MLTAAATIPRCCIWVYIGALRLAAGKMTESDHKHQRFAGYGGPRPVQNRLLSVLK